jgi:pimeloyl-ACP methyl ester carboxylesterase
VPVRHHRLASGEVTTHYVTAGDASSGATPVVLLHGFPQTWAQWRAVIERLESERPVVAVDLRGLGGWPGPATGYDKRTMAADVRAVTAELYGDTPVIVVGHDIGAFVAYAYARRYLAHTDRLMLVDAPVPGTAFFDDVRANPRVWHMNFHCARDLAERLVSGREDVYVEYFIRTRLVDPSRIRREQIAEYAAAYAAPGALRAAFEWYRAFDEDTAVNRAEIATAGRLGIPVSVVGGAASIAGSALNEMVAEIAEDWECHMVEDTGHWISEEQPDALVDAIAALAARPRREVSRP